MTNLMQIGNWDDGEEFNAERVINEYGFDAIMISKARPLYEYLLSHPERYELKYEESKLAYFRVKP